MRRSKRLCASESLNLGCEMVIASGLGKAVGAVAGKSGGGGAGIGKLLGGIVGKATKSPFNKGKDKKKAKPASTKVAESVGKIVKQKEAERRKQMKKNAKGTRIKVGRK